MKRIVKRLFVYFLSLFLVFPVFSVPAYASDIWDSDEWWDGSDEWWDDSSSFPGENVSPSATSGTFGDAHGFTWKYNKKTDVLTITGEDEGIDELRYYLPRKVRSNTEKVVFEDCVVTGGSMTYMFSGLRDCLTSVDFSGLDTSDVEDMAYMFYWCENLESVDMRGLDTSNVTDMTEMFSHCASLESVNMRGLDTSNVTDMSCMFWNCEELTNVDMTGWDTSNVEDMSDMFAGCDSLRRISTPKVMAEGMSMELPITFGDFANNTIKKVTSKYCNKTLGKQYKITYYLNDGVNDADNPEVYNEVAATISLKKPKKTGYTFEGWYTSDKYKTKVSSIAKGSSGNKKLYAKWTVNKYNIAFNGNKSTSGSVTSLKNCVYGKSYSLKKNTFKRTGYTFKGWNTKADGSGTAYSDKASVKNLTASNGKTVTLYAQWKPIEYSITYKLHGGDNNTGNPKTYTPESGTITLKKANKEGYKFVGWYSDSKLKKQVKTIKKGSTGNMTLYAKWETEKYSIKYNLNKGKNHSKNPANYSITTSTIKLQNPTRKGYVFKGWYSDKKLKNQVKTIKKGSTGNMTLYAKWVKAKKK